MTTRNTAAAPSSSTDNAVNSRNISTRWFAVAGVAAVLTLGACSNEPSADEILAGDTPSSQGEESAPQTTEPESEPSAKPKSEKETNRATTSAKTTQEKKREKAAEKRDAEDEPKRKEAPPADATGGSAEDAMKGFVEKLVAGNESAAKKNICPEKRKEYNGFVEILTGDKVKITVHYDRGKEKSTSVRYPVDAKSPADGDMKGTFGMKNASGWCVDHMKLDPEGRNIPG